ncbi:MAG TPA: energy transducer TonB, partial [Gemmatimonadaceae bacterium]|nr:energy transducer TonB [Gemmatimonadaceae bacterium]
EPGVMGERPKRINDGPYQEFQVEQSARWIGGDPPVYPEALKKAGVEGEVRVSLVIDERGRVGAYEVLQSPSPLFTNAVRKAIPTMRFEAAQVGGKAVRQILEMPFVFRIK